MKRNYASSLALVGLVAFGVAGCAQAADEAKPGEAGKEGGAKQETKQPQPEPLKAGTVAPDFTLPDQDNKSHKLSDYKGQTVILAFYPADMTKGCTLEAHNLTEALNEFGKRKVQVFGISVQDVKSKKEFCDKENIKYPLLADTEKKVSQNYGVLNARGLSNRVSFVIAPDGKILHIEREVKIPTHAQDLMAVIDKAQKSSDDKSKTQEK